METTILTVNQKQTILGLLAQVNVGNSITATTKPHTAARQDSLRILINSVIDKLAKINYTIQHYCKPDFLVKVFVGNMIGK